MNRKRSCILIALFLSIGLFLGGTNISEAAVKAKPVFEIVEVVFEPIPLDSNRFRVSFRWDNIKTIGYEASISSETKEVFYLLNTRQELWTSADITVGTNTDIPMDELGTYIIKVALIDKFGRVMKPYVLTQTYEVTDLHPIP